MNRIPMRDGYGEALLDLCRRHDDIIVLDADVAQSTRTNWVMAQCPDHFIDMGIAEQDMVGTAAGMALAGLVPFISTYGVFLTGRAWDQIRNAVCYNGLNVKLGGAHAGISVGPDGASHQALEDVALMRVVPGMTVIVPCDSMETYKATMAVYDYPGPCYVRFGRDPVPVLTDKDTPFAIGKARLVRSGTDVTILANGTMVYQSLAAAEKLQQEGLSARVVDVHTVKPLDETMILDCARETGAIVVCEEHQRIGGLGGAVCELLAGYMLAPVRLVGMHDSFGESGWPEELIDAYGMSVENIVQAVRDVLKQT
jgi:transketolase